MPLAMGELFNTQQEYVPLIAERLIDFIRIHISQIGGLSMARKVAALCEFFGVKTAWHGPGDCSPVGHAAGLAPGAGQPQLRHPRRRRLPDRDPRGLPRLPRDQGRLHVRQRGPGPGHRHRREARRQVPGPRRPDLRLPLGHDPPARWHGDPALSRAQRATPARLPHHPGRRTTTRCTAWPLSTLVSALPVVTLFFVLVVLRTRVWVAALAGLLMSRSSWRSSSFGMPAIAGRRRRRPGRHLRPAPDRLDHRRLDLPLPHRRRDRASSR